MRTHPPSAVFRTNYLGRGWVTLVTALALTACGSGEPGPAPAATALSSESAAPAAADPPDARSTANLWRGDLDGMAARRLVRMLVVYNKTSYFLDKTQQRGAAYEMGQVAFS